MRGRSPCFESWKGGAMMINYRSRWTVFLILFLVVSACDTSRNVEPRFQNYFVKYFGDEGDQSAADLIVNSDGSMVLLGNSVLPAGNKTPFLVHLNPVGDIVWELTFGENETAVDIEAIHRGAHQGGFVIVSNLGDIEHSRIRIWRISPGGSVIDSVTITDQNPDAVTQIARSITSLTGRDGFVVTGSADAAFTVETSPEIIAPSDSDILALYIDDTFSVVENIVSKGGEMNGSGVRVFEMPDSPDNQFVLFSYTDRPFRTNAFGYNFSYDIISSGVPIGQLIGSEEDREVLATVIKTPLILGEGFLMVGTSLSGSSSQGDIYLVKFNSSFEYKSFDKKVELGINIECVSAAVAPSGYYVLSNEIVDASVKNILLTKMTSDGNVEWVRSFGAQDSEDTASAIHTLPDGRIAIVGTMQLKTRRKMALIVVNSNGAF